ncbi:hypothetical protein [Georgenia sp. SYP-B2076]|uniref:hypothetical protein n=1 Tax=Georgenia sp. SYP-B2076 TaxID=2495881 RepID=UPI000F8DC6A4|nr:hypothetical protein [Georgenia sp. SYP-B2076]
MAVLVIARLDGDPEQLAGQIQEHLAPVMNKLSPPRGALWHALAKTPDGVLVVDVWETGDGLTNALSEPEVQHAIERGGLPQPRIDIYELVDYRSL